MLQLRDNYWQHWTPKMQILYLILLFSLCQVLNLQQTAKNFKGYFVFLKASSTKVNKWIHPFRVDSNPAHPEQGCQVRMNVQLLKKLNHWAAARDNNTTASFCCYKHFVFERKHNQILRLKLFSWWDPLWTHDRDFEGCLKLYSLCRSALGSLNISTHYTPIIHRLCA